MRHGLAYLAAGSLWRLLLQIAAGLLSLVLGIYVFFLRTRAVAEREKREAERGDPT